MSDSDSYTVMVPTRSRPAFVRRLTSYYAEAGLRGTVLVADSGNLQVFAENAVAIEAARRQGLSVRHLPCDGLHYAQKLAVAFDAVETAHALLIADDDLVGRPYLEAAAAILANDVGCAAVAGATVLYSLDRLGAVGRPTDIRPLPPVAARAEGSAAARIALHEAARRGTLFDCMRRTADWRAIARMIGALHQHDAQARRSGGFSWIGGYFYEIAVDYMTLSAGKLVSRAHLMNARQLHLDESNAGTGMGKETDVADGLSDSAWAPMLDSVVGIVASRLAAAEAMAVDDARRFVQGCVYRRILQRLPEVVYARTALNAQARDAVPLSRGGAIIRRIPGALGLARTVRQALRGLLAASDSRRTAVSTPSPEFEGIRAWLERNIG